MAEVHLVVGVAVVALNLVAGAWGGVSWFAGRPSVAFWYLLRGAQGAVVVQVLLGVGLVLSGHEPKEGIHYLYGLLPLLVSVIAEAGRATAAATELGDVEFKELGRDRQRALAMAIVRREMGIMAVSAVVIFGLALRAALTSGKF